MKKNDNVTIPRALLLTIQHALNKIPNTRNAGVNGESTYNIASMIDLAVTMDKNPKAITPPMKFNTTISFSKSELKNCDAIEVSPVCFVGGDAVEVCEKEHADFYSVYLHRKSGGVHCVADCEDEKAANKLSKLLEIVSKELRG